MKTSLYKRHIKLNAKIVDFAGYQMPINYPEGISKECYSVRKNVGFFLNYEEEESKEKE